MLNSVTLLIGYCDYAAIYSWINYVWDYLYKWWVGFPSMWNSIKTFITIDQGKAYHQIFVYTRNQIHQNFRWCLCLFFSLSPFSFGFQWYFIVRCFIPTGNSANSAASCPHIFKSLKVYWKFDLQFVLDSAASLQIALLSVRFWFQIWDIWVIWWL